MDTGKFTVCGVGSCCLSNQGCNDDSASSSSGNQSTGGIGGGGGIGACSSSPSSSGILGSSGCGGLTGKSCKVIHFSPVNTGESHIFVYGKYTVIRRTNQ